MEGPDDFLREETSLLVLRSHDKLRVVIDRNVEDEQLAEEVERFVLLFEVNQIDYESLQKYGFVPTQAEHVSLLSEDILKCLQEIQVCLAALSTLLNYESIVLIVHLRVGGIIRQDDIDVRHDQRHLRSKFVRCRGEDFLVLLRQFQILIVLLLEEFSQARDAEVKFGAHVFILFQGHQTFKQYDLSDIEVSHRE